MIKKNEVPKIILLFAVLAGCCLLLRPAQHLFLIKSFPQGYAALVENASRETGVSPSLIYAVIRTESHFRPDAESYAGAVGLMQLTPDTFDWVQSLEPGGERLPSGELTDPAVNIEYGAKLLRRLFDEFLDPTVALSAYHAGRGNVQKWLSDPACSPDGKSLANIPIKDTREYVAKVLDTVSIYDALYVEGAAS